MPWIILLLFFLLGCPELPAQDFYDPDTINIVQLYFTQTNWDSILDQYYAAGDEERLVGTAIINGVTYDSVGVRYKGNSTYGANQAKNPLNIKLDYIIDDQQIDGKYGTIKLANGKMDPSFVREVLAYEIARKYMPAGGSNYAVVYVNDVQLGVYVNDQDVDSYFAGQFLHCQGKARFKGDNDQSQARTIWGYVNADSSSYSTHYSIESDEGWDALIEFLNQYNNTTSFDDVLNIDQHLWFLAFSNLVVNLDGPINFDHNYYLFQDSADRFNPIVWDLNMAFGGFTQDLANGGGGGGGGLSVSSMQQLSPYFHQTSAYYPIISRVLSIPMYKRMYIAHMRTILNENFSNGWYDDRAHELSDFIAPYVQTDTNYLYTFANFQSNVDSAISGGGGGPGGGGGQSSCCGITQLMDTRSSYLLSSSNFAGTVPAIASMNYSPATVTANSTVNFTMSVANASTAYLGYRQDVTEPFTRLQMFDDGQHNDGASGDGVFGTSVLIGYGDVQYYGYAENTAYGAFSPARAEFEFYSIDVLGATGNVVINEINYNSISTFNTGDWIELTNPGTVSVDISAWVYKDENDGHAYVIPDNTTLDPGEYLVICENTTRFTSLFPDVTNYVGNADFGLSGSGELVRLYDSNGTLIDSLIFDDEAPWPTAADGQGGTLELIDPSSDNTLGANWASDGTIHGTPGTQNSVTISMYITYLVPSMAGSDLTLSWSAASGATSYRVYRGTTPNLLSLYTTVAAPNTTFTDTDAGTDGVNYYYRVTAVR
jgi:hypothetical protein